jgi:ABC-type uncharacterized transport system YnjBCD permease subunit
MDVCMYMCMYTDVCMHICMYIYVICVYPVCTHADFARILVPPPPTLSPPVKDRFSLVHREADNVSPLLMYLPA